MTREKTYAPEESWLDRKMMDEEAAWDKDYDDEEREEEDADNN
jgi:hypothetical protein